MKKKTKIVLGVVGGLSAAALGLGGILVYQSNQVINQVSLYGVEPMTFERYNARYEYFVGNNQSAINVKTLIRMVNARNSNIEETNLFGVISIIGINDVDMVSNSKRYNVLIEEYSEDNYIKSIRIEENS